MLKSYLIVLLIPFLFACGRAHKSGASYWGRMGGLSEVQTSRVAYEEVRGANDMSRIPIGWPYHIITTGFEWGLERVELMDDDYHLLGIHDVVGVDIRENVVCLKVNVVTDSGQS